MQAAVNERVSGYLVDALGTPIDVDQLPGDTSLNSLGLDSLMTISVLVSLLEDAGVDLAEHADSLVTPSTVGDLCAIAVRFLGPEDPAAEPVEASADDRSQLEHYQQKLAYEIDSADLQMALDDGQDIVVVDGRSSDAFELEHIPGAVSIPHRSISQESLSGLSRTPLYVAYCDGIGCNASTKTAIKFASAGFRVKELIGGLDWWKRDGHATEGNAARGGMHLLCGCSGEATAVHGAPA